MTSFCERFITRKFVAATLTAFLLAICWVLCQWLTQARDNYSALATALVGALSAYTAGNVVQDHIFTRNTKTTTVAQQVADFVMPKPQPEKPE